MIHNKLRARIIEMFGTQADFAEAIKFDESLVSRVVRGRWNLNADEIERWSEALGRDVSELLER